LCIGVITESVVLAHSLQPPSAGRHARRRHVALWQHRVKEDMIYGRPAGSGPQ
jgi:hypothetical protein